MSSSIDDDERLFYRLEIETPAQANSRNKYGYKHVFGIWATCKTTTSTRLKLVDWYDFSKDSLFFLRKKNRRWTIDYVSLEDGLPTQIAAGLVDSDHLLLSASLLRSLPAQTHFEKTMSKEFRFYARAIDKDPLTSMQLCWTIVDTWQFASNELSPMGALRTFIVNRYHRFFN